MCRCLILLSTYNGEKYLPELLESVLAQKDIYVDILARDDGSTDPQCKMVRAVSGTVFDLSLIHISETTRPY